MRSLTRNLNASQWNIGCVGSQTLISRIGHIHFMFFCVDLIFVGYPTQTRFQWNMGFRYKLAIVSSHIFMTVSHASVLLQVFLITVLSSTVSALTLYVEYAKMPTYLYYQLTYSLCVNYTDHYYMFDPLPVHVVCLSRRSRRWA